MDIKNVQVGIVPAICGLLVIAGSVWAGAERIIKLETEVLLKAQVQQTTVDKQQEAIDSLLKLAKEQNDRLIRIETLREVERAARERAESQSDE